METSNRPGYYGNQGREEKTGILQSIKDGGSKILKRLLIGIRI